MRAIYTQPDISQADLARHFDVSRATVCKTVTRMMRDGLAIVEDGAVTLTAEGADYARTQANRHDFILSICHDLGMTTEAAKTEADKLEHVISSDMLQRMRERIPFRV